MEGASLIRKRFELSNMLDRYLEQPELHADDRKRVIDDVLFLYKRFLTIEAFASLC